MDILVMGDGQVALQAVMVRFSYMPCTYRAFYGCLALSQAKIPLALLCRSYLIYLGGQRVRFVEPALSALLG